MLIFIYLFQYLPGGRGKEVDNLYVVEIINILNQIKRWIFTFIRVVTVVIVVKNAFDYQEGDSAEKQEAARNIKRTLIMGGGIFFLA